MYFKLVFLYESLQWTLSIETIGATSLEKILGRKLPLHWKQLNTYNY